MVIRVAGRTVYQLSMWALESDDLGCILALPLSNQITLDKLLKFPKLHIFIYKMELIIKVPTGEGGLQDYI